jgi:hypothetical protein
MLQSVIIVKEVDIITNVKKKHLPLTVVGSNTDRDFGSFQVRKLSRVAYGTSVVLLRYPFVFEIFINVIF